MRWTMALQDELDSLRKEKTGVEKLSTKLLAFEAAMVVLARHNLMVEFADELNRSPQESSSGR